MTRNRLRSWVRALVAYLQGQAVPPRDEPLQHAPPASGMSISYAAQWEAQRTGRPAVLPETIFAPYVPAPGVLPSGLAMDSCTPAASLGSLSAWALQGVFHEGLAFLGYPYLAELAQRTEYRRIAEIWAEHAVRKWIKLSGPEATVKAINDEFTRLNVRDAFQEACEQDCQFGRSQVFMDFDDAENEPELRTPLLRTDAKVKPARALKRLKVVEPVWSYPGMYDTANPLAESFYKPREWFVFGKTVHTSRFLTFVGREVPDMLKPAYAFGGLSMTQMAKAYVDNWLRSRQSVSDMMHSYSCMVLATDMGATLTGGPATDLFNRVDMANRTRDNRGTWVIDKGSEELTNVAVPLAGLGELQSQAQEQMASAAGIPLSIYLQVTPSGLDSSTEDEIRSFYAAVKALQQKLFRPNLAVLLEVVQLSLFGKIDPTVTFDFPDLWEMSRKEEAEVDKLDAETDTALVAMGAISNEEVRDRMVMDEGGRYHGLTGPAPEPEVEDEPDPKETD